MTDAHHLSIYLALLTTTIAVASPLLLAALGEVVAERAGVINVGIEGMMLCGAYAAYAASHSANSAGWGAAGAIIAGMAVSALFALMVLKFRADQVVVGTAINILALGVTGVLTSLLSTYSEVPSFHPHIVYRHGDATVSVDILAWIALAMTVPVSLYLYRTNAGLRLRAVGEYPAAAEDAGTGVAAARLGAILFGGGMAGLAGACLSIGYSVGIAQGLSSGRGFIALAVVIVGRWTPVGALIAAVLFGFATALQASYQAANIHIPYQALLALPYVLTLVALVIRAGRASAPAALGEAYASE